MIFSFIWKNIRINQNIYFSVNAQYNLTFTNQKKKKNKEMIICASFYVNKNKKEKTTYEMKIAEKYKYVLLYFNWNILHKIFCAAKNDI